MTPASLIDHAELGFADALTFAQAPDTRVRLAARQVLDHTPRRCHLRVEMELAWRATRKRAVVELDGPPPETFARLDRLTCLADASHRCWS